MLCPGSHGRSYGRGLRRAARTLPASRPSSVSAYRLSSRRWISSLLFVVAVMFGSFVFTHNEHCIGRFDPEGPTHFAGGGALAGCIGVCDREVRVCKARAPLTPEHGKWRPVRVIRNAIS